MIPAGRAAVIRALDDEGVDYVVTDETSGREYTAVATFPLPTAAVEPVLERLREVGIDESTYTIVAAAAGLSPAGSRRSKTSTPRRPNTQASISRGRSCRRRPTTSPPGSGRTC